MTVIAADIHGPVLLGSSPEADKKRGKRSLSPGKLSFPSERSPKQSAKALPVRVAPLDMGFDSDSFPIRSVGGPVCPPAPRGASRSLFGRAQPLPKTPAVLKQRPALLSFSSLSTLSVQGIPPLTKDELHLRDLERAIQNPQLKESIAQFVVNAEKIHETKSIVLRDGSSVVLTPIKGAEGQHNEIYTVTGSPLISNVDNTKIVVRLPKREQFDRINSIATMLKMVREANTDMRIVGVPTIPIYNRNSMFTDGYIAVPKIPYKFTLTQNNLVSVKNLFANCYVFDIPADAHHGTGKGGYKDSNFRSEREFGAPLVCDWLEISEDKETALESRFTPLIPRCLPSFYHGAKASQLDAWTPKDIMDALDPRILDITWDKDTGLPNLTEKAVTEAILFLRGQKERFRNEIIGRRESSEKAREKFLQQVAAKEKDIGLPLLTAYNLLMLKTNPEIVTQYRLNKGPVQLISDKSAIANGNPSVAAFLGA